MYDAVSDPYCYPGTTVLKNLLDIRDQSTLDRYEAEVTAVRAEQPVPSGAFDVAHYCAFHRHLFQDVYDWAGLYRTVRIGKGGSAFCYPEYIEPQMVRLFSRLQADDYFRHCSQRDFAASAAHFLAELNSIHPFREGNGRTQLAFFIHLAEASGHPLHVKRMDPTAVMAAMISSFLGDERQLRNLIDTLL